MLRRGMTTLAVAALAAMLAGCGREAAPEAMDAEPDVVVGAEMPPGEDVAPIERSGEPIYVGVWASDEALCALTPGSADPSPLAITEAEFIGYENRCRVAGADEGTEGGFLIELVCEAEGVEYTETVEIDVDAGSMSMSRADGSVARYVRCS